MLSQKLFRWMQRIALIAMVFASLAPSVSHALAGQGSQASFMQEVCGTGGKKIYIQVVTTQGKQIQTALDFQPNQNPASLTHHLNHCPFCSIQLDVVLDKPVNPAYVLYQVAQARLALVEYVSPVVSPVFQTAQPLRAPPFFS
ncbi:MAG: DUF2946 domain-containing protein [Methylophilus sp.]|nr:DUF2946 domain-containing protein [Methylophilus sp.]